MSLDDVAEQLLTLTNEELFHGTVPAKTVYRSMVKAIHPDHHPEADRGRAEKLMAELASRYENFTNPQTIQITTKNRTYSLPHESIHGDIANLYVAGSVLVKMPRSAGDSDLIKREAVALRRMAESIPVELAHLAPYALPLVETFRHKDAKDGAVRQVNVVKNLNDPESSEKGWFSLAEVAKAYPDGLGGRDIAWMWRRIYVATGLAHACGIVHGAIVPEHVMIHPTLHGVILVDWCYSSVAPDMSGSGSTVVTMDYPPIPAFVPGRKDLYPPEVAEKKAPTPTTDIYMASATMATLCGKNTPPQFARFAKGCMLSSPGMRPQTAFGIQEEFDSLLLNLYGKRTYVPFSMPPGATPNGVK